METTILGFRALGLLSPVSLRFGTGRVRKIGHVRKEGICRGQCFLAAVLAK